LQVVLKKNRGLIPVLAPEARPRAVEQSKRNARDLRRRFNLLLPCPTLIIGRISGAGF